MPRMGLTTAEVVLSAAELADEIGIRSVSLAALAARLGVKAPALYKHVDGIDDLQRRIATLAMTELSEALRDALQGRAGSDAIATFFSTLRSYIARHPGRYSATTGAQFQGQNDPFFIAASRVIGSVRAVLSGYNVQPNEMDHAIRALRCMIHGYAMLQAENGFQWTNDPDQSFEWMIKFVDAGLAAVSVQEPSQN